MVLNIGVAIEDNRSKVVESGPFAYMARSLIMHVILGFKTGRGELAREGEVSVPRVHLGNGGGGEGGRTGLSLGVWGGMAVVYWGD